ncbi:MAG: hypothetical protein LBF51_11090 [Zoogloeaceae bacterium]|nr:hypothetical protein [Zoogloeaceae bacterium]
MPEPNRLSAGAGVAWIREGWDLMQVSMGTWIGIGFAWICIYTLLNLLGNVLIPNIGVLAQILLTPVFIAGPMLACRAKERDDDVRFEHLFAGFSNRTGTLMLLGVFYSLAFLFIAAILGVSFALLVGFGNLPNLPNLRAGGSIIPYLLPILLASLFIIPLVLVVWLSTPLVALHGELTAWKAFKLAARGLLRNLLPFTVNGIAYTGLFILALIPLGLGFLIVIPLIFCTCYAAYRDIFVRSR